MNTTPAEPGQFRIRANYDSAVVTCVPCTWYVENVQSSAPAVTGVVGDRFRNIDLAEIAAMTALHRCPAAVTAAWAERRT
jgi:hypothetical protein